MISYLQFELESKFQPWTLRFAQLQLFSAFSQLSLAFIFVQLQFPFELNVASP